MSYAYLVASALALVATLSVSRLHDFVARRWIVTGSLGLLLGSVAVFAVADGAMFGVGIAMLASGAAVFSVCISLFTVENVNKAALTAHESRRMVYNGLAWMVGPVFAAWLSGSLGPLAPFVLSAVFAGVALVYFWSIRLGPPTAFNPRAAGPGIAQNVPRFFRQRYLRIAYAVTLVRGVFWAGLFIYAPMYVVEAGLPTWMAGLLLSTAAGLLLASPLVQRAAERRGTRHVVVRGFTVLTAALLSLAWIGEPAPIGVAVWFVAAAGGAMIDVVANIPFMRTVRPREQVEMTTVFSTWREVSSMVAPAIGAAVLLIGPFRLYYVVLAGCTLLTGVWATWLPRRV